jgi:hypothetical protein
MKQRVSEALRRYAQALFGLGINPRKFLALRDYPRYRRDLRAFRKAGGEVAHKFMILSDFTDQAGTAKGHYFHQDLLVASLIFENKPKRHIDIGSRIDGFVAHVASFRPIEVYDVRALKDTGHSNITFAEADLMQGATNDSGVADSLSCLHAIEHFGLGRYGDQIDPSGHLKGFRNLIKMLQISGRLYISFPIGRQDEVHFNAHRVFHPKSVLSWPTGGHKLTLERFDYVDDQGTLHKQADLDACAINVQYGCGIYTFKKDPA